MKTVKQFKKKIVTCCECKKEYAYSSTEAHLLKRRERVCIDCVQKEFNERHNIKYENN